MHRNNNIFLDDSKSKYPANFVNARVIELGSNTFSGSIRGWFENCEYVGVDVVDGDGVDVVDYAKNVKFENEYFDTIASFSMLEHDLEWKLSLGNILPFLKKGGMLFMCWGAEENQPHMDIWKLVPHQEVLDFLKESGMEVLDGFFEEERYGKDCLGAYDVVAKKIIN